MSRYDIIIIGAGPAGMTAAIYALRSNKRVLLLEAKSYGGQIVNAYKIENYPGLPNVSGYELATNMYNQVKELGCSIKYETVIKIEKNMVVTNKDEYRCKAIILATGVKNRRLDIENEDKYIGKGISYCAICDGNFYKDKIVAVVGGGNSALEDALYLSSVAKKVYLIHRRDFFRGDNKYLEKIKDQSNIEILTNVRVIKLLGDEVLSGIEVQDKMDINKKIVIDGLFIAIGQEPNNKMFSDVVDLDNNGYIISRDGVHTSCDGIYVAGDARVKNLRQLTTAVADGSITASVVIKELEREGE